MLRLEPIAGPAGLPPPPPITGDRAVLGRWPDCDVRLPHEAVSKHHAAVERRGDTWYVSDLGSRHGTFLNTIKLPPKGSAPLAESDHLRVAPWTFRVRFGAATTFSTTEVEEATVVQRVSTIDHDATGVAARQQLEMLLAASAAIYGAPSEVGLLEAVLETALLGTGFQRAAILRRLGPAEEVELVTSRDAHGAPCPKIVVSRSLLRAASRGSMARLDDAGVNQAHSIMSAGLTAALCVPIRLEAAIWGFLYLDSSGGNLSGDPTALCAWLAQMSSLALERIRRREMQDRVMLIQRDLELAAEVQRRMMPFGNGRAEFLSYSVLARPGRLLSGDLLGVIQLPEERVAVFLGDVSGKGFGAAFLMAVAQTFLEAALTQSPDPGAAITSLQRHIQARMPAARFVSLWLAVFSASDSTVRVADAGHGYVLAVNPEDEPQSLSFRGGPVIGAVDDFVYESDELVLSSGSRIIPFSDGVVEQPRPSGEQFGIERAIDALRGSASPSEDVQRLFQAVSQFAATDALADDVTIASFDPRPPGEATRA